jgi:cytidine deaminase
MDEARLAALVAAAREARASAYAPYSGFAVGAAIGVGARTFVGVNVENASFPVSQCAERNAIATMVAAGVRDPDAIAIVTDAGAPTPPCGACRQALAEFGGAAMAVVAETLAGDRVEWSLGELLPQPFDREAPR